MDFKERNILPQKTEDSFLMSLFLSLLFFSSYERFCSTCAIRSGEEASPNFFENQKKCLVFGKKGPDCLHPWLKFSIQNVVLRLSRRKNSKMFPREAFFLLFLTKCLSKFPNSTKTPLHQNISVCVPEL